MKKLDDVLAQFSIMVEQCLARQEIGRDDIDVNGDDSEARGLKHAKHQIYTDLMELLPHKRVKTLPNITGFNEAVDLMEVAIKEYCGVEE